MTPKQFQPGIRQEGDQEDRIDGQHPALAHRGLQAQLEALNDPGRRSTEHLTGCLHRIARPAPISSSKYTIQGLNNPLLCRMCGDTWKEDPYGGRHKCWTMACSSVPPWHGGLSAYNAFYYAIRNYERASGRCLLNNQNLLCSSGFVCWWPSPLWVALAGCSTTCPWRFRSWQRKRTGWLTRPMPCLRKQTSSCRIWSRRGRNPPSSSTGACRILVQTEKAETINTQLPALLANQRSRSTTFPICRAASSSTRADEGSCMPPARIRDCSPTG